MADPSWLVALGFLLVGLVIGSVLTRFWLSRSRNATSYADQLADVKEQYEAYRRDVAEHFTAAQSMAEEVSDIQTKLNQFIHDSSYFLQNEKEWESPLKALDFQPALGEQEADVSIDSIVPEQDTASGVEPPRDYSEPGSGLFSSHKQKTN